MSTRQQAAEADDWHMMRCATRLQRPALHVDLGMAAPQDTWITIAQGSQ